MRTKAILDIVQDFQAGLHSVDSTWKLRSIRNEVVQHILLRGLSRLRFARTLKRVVKYFPRYADVSLGVTARVEYEYTCSNPRGTSAYDDADQAC